METNGIERPVLAVDVVVFSIDEGHLWVLLSLRKNEPFKDAPALPGVAVQIDETLLTAARRALTEKAGRTSLVKEDVYLDQLAAFDALYRDPRGRTVSVAYMGLTHEKPLSSGMMIWRRVSDISKGDLPFDHDSIVETAEVRLRGKLRYTNIAKGFLPEAFRIEELQNIYETILKCSLNRTNLRNKLLKIGMIEQISILTDAVGKKGGRPPHLYRFTKGLIKAVDRDFL